MSSAPPGPAAPRLCCLEKGPDGYGFHLHGEKGKPGQFIRLVEAGSPAERSGLRAGDRLLEVDGTNVERESHQQVVERIRAAAGAVRLLVVQPQPEEQPPKPHSDPDGEVQREAPAAEPPAAERSGDTGERVSAGRYGRPLLSCWARRSRDGAPRAFLPVPVAARRVVPLLFRPCVAGGAKRGQARGEGARLMATRGQGVLPGPSPVSPSVLWELGLVLLLFVVFAPGVLSSSPQPCCVFTS